MNPMDLNRLAYRIERLQQQSTHDWMPGDDLEFKNQLPNSRVCDPRRKLPDPQVLRSASLKLAAGEASEFTPQQYRDAVQRCLRMENLIHQNKPTSTRRMMYDMRRGRPPGFRR